MPGICYRHLILSDGLLLMALLVKTDMPMGRRTEVGLVSTGGSTYECLREQLFPDIESNER